MEVETTNREFTYNSPFLNFITFFLSPIKYNSAFADDALGGNNFPS